MSPAACRVVVCRGCCCGTPSGADRDAQLDALRDRLGVDAVRTSECLGPCDHANVIVVLPSRAGRQRGGRPTWLGFVDSGATTVSGNATDDATDAVSGGATEDVAAWAASGGPGITPLPATLELHLTGPLPPIRPAPVERDAPSEDRVALPGDRVTPSGDRVAPS